MINFDLDLESKAESSTRSSVERFSNTKLTKSLQVLLLSKITVLNIRWNDTLTWLLESRTITSSEQQSIPNFFLLLSRKMSIILFITDFEFFSWLFFTSNSISKYSLVGRSREISCKINHQSLLGLFRF